MEDLFRMEELFSSEERQLRDTVRSWSDQYVLPVITEAFETARFPEHLIPSLAQLGLFGMTLPKKYGGSEASYVSYGLACQELERADSALRSFLSVQSALCMFAIAQFGDSSQKEKFLPTMAAGKCIGCFGLTEAGSGSDPSSLKTKAVKVKGGWQLEGSKLWITNACLADLAVVWAKTTGGIRGFIVEMRFEGVSRRRLHHKLSMRASDTGELTFSQCFVPDSHYLEATECGIKAALTCLTQARYGIAWGSVGAAEACFDLTKAYVLDRQQFGKPLAASQLVQRELVEMLTEITKTRCLNYHLGRLADSHQVIPEHVSMAKMNAARVALEVARRCRNLLGANGISLEYHVIRHLANLETVFTYEGTDNIHHLILGKYLTGINAF